MSDSTDPKPVLTLAPSPGNRRNSEGSFVELQDGRILFLYSRFEDSPRDNALCSLVARISADRGRTWTRQDQIVVPHPPQRNVMSVSLLRLQDDRIALFYLLKESAQGWRVQMRLSEDEARNWSEPRTCHAEPGLYVMNNDRAVQLRGGRIVLPVAVRPPEPGVDASEQLITCLLSDDGGATWRPSRNGRRAPGVWTQEPGVVERRDGRLLLWCRTQMGCQYVSDSDDRGETWSELKPSRITSTLSPASIKRIPATGDLLLVWNNVDQPWAGWDELRRSPLNSAISRDEGRTWESVKTIADDPALWYCYTAIAFIDDLVLLAHQASGGGGADRMSTLRITRRPVNWFYP